MFKRETVFDTLFACRQLWSFIADAMHSAILPASFHARWKNIAKKESPAVHAWNKITLKVFSKGAWSGSYKARRARLPDADDVLNTWGVIVRRNCWKNELWTSFARTWCVEQTGAHDFWSSVFPFMFSCVSAAFTTDGTRIKNLEKHVCSNDTRMIVLGWMVLELQALSALPAF